MPKLGVLNHPMKTLLPLVLVLLCICTKAQTHFCYTDQVWQRMTEENPSLLQLRNDAEDVISKQSNEFVPEPFRDDRAESVPAFVIPTVIYIIHDGTAASNISMQQIQSQMDQLNEDFAPQGYAFCYAKRNVLDTTYFVPQAGDSAGVFRISDATLSDLEEYTEDAQLKALSTLPAQRYLRIFVVKNISPAGVAGYALLPGSGSSRDGIVVKAEVFGSNNYCQSCGLMPQYNLGKALTHEVGHYLNLYHTFQGGCTPEPQPGISCAFLGDRVCDTPPTAGTYGCPSPAPLSCDNTNPQQIENYMDYTNDACKTMFSGGQKARMDQSVNAYRGTLISTENLIRTGVTCVQIGNQYANIFSANFNGCTNRDMQFASLNSPGFTYTWNFGDGTTTTGDTVNHIYTSTGQYQLSLSAVNTSQNISATKMIPVFINDCAPINCRSNKWDANYSYLDFSSGTPVATNHIKAITYLNNLPCFYQMHYVADDNGNPLFHYWPGGNHGRPELTPLFDTAFNIVDSVLLGWGYHILPVKSTPGKYCMIAVRAYITSNILGTTDSIMYSFVQAQNGTVRVLPGKKTVNVPLPAGTNFFTGTNLTAAIPNCDGSAFWFIAYLSGGKFGILKMTDDTVVLDNVFNLQAISGQNPYHFTASPDGRRLLVGPVMLQSGTRGYYLLNFNKGNGTFTSYTTIEYGNNPYYSGVRPCFSPNSRFLYITEPCCAQAFGNTGYVYQLDILSTDIWASRKVIYEFPRDNSQQGRPSQFIYNGPDKKTYVGHFPNPGNAPSSYRLGVINLPNVKEDGLNSVGYNNNGPYIVPDNCPYPTSSQGFSGKPIDDTYDCNWNANGAPTYNAYATGCRQYNFYTDECYSSTWNFGDPASGSSNASTVSNPTHSFSAPGNYAVTLVSNGQTFTDTIRIAAPDVNITQFTPGGCSSANSIYTAVQPQPGVNYIWTVTGGTPASVTGVMDINVQWNTGVSNGQIKLVAIDTLYGCSDSSVTNITISQGGITEPVVTLSGTTLNTTIYNSYQWLLNGSVILNANQQQYTATQTGLYEVIVSNGPGCTDTSKPVQITITGITDIPNPTFELYPNPATESLTITTSEGDATLTVYDTQGKRVYQTNLRSTTQTLNISNWTGGIYYIEVNQQGKTARKKFVKL